MNKKIYIVQPTYRKMDGTRIKGWTLFNHSLFLPIFSAVIPEDWEKETCLEYYNEINYDSDASVILISCMGYDIMYARDIARIFKQKGKKVIFGAHWDEFSEKILNEVCDSVFYGYPNKKGMAKMLNDTIYNKMERCYRFDMDLNFPFDYSVLEGMNFPIMQVQASIGCKNNCAYCCAAQVYNSRYRLRKIDYVMSDLQAVSKTSRNLSFMDQNIYNNPEYTKRLCRRIIDENLKIRWGAQATPDIGDDDLMLELLSEAGCKVIFLGLESIDQLNLKQLNKRFFSGQYEEQVKNIRRHGIHVVGYFMLGMDHDTSESFNSLYDFVKKVHLIIPIINVLIPVPGTGIFRCLKEQDRLLINNEKEFEDDDPLYSVPTNRVFFKPAVLSADELSNGIAELGRRLFTLKNIILRSITKNLLDSLIIFIMNMELRKKYYSM